jgi:hypothetical protein
MLAWVHVLLKEQQQSGQEGSRSPGGEGVQELNNPYSRALQHALATVKVSDYRPAAGVKYLMELYTRVTGHDSTQQSARPADTGGGHRGPVRRSQVSAFGRRYFSWALPDNHGVMSRRARELQVIACKREIERPPVQLLEARSVRSWVVSIE